uniref:fibrocystin-L-like n=1 Tax=Ciona intestinalis TaxID=7719 RepID=UPI00089DC9B0
MERAIAYVLLFVIGTIVTSEAQETTYVSYMTPKYGGENGATQIKIFGQGFAVQMTFAGEEPRKEVFLVNSVNQYVCDIHEAESDETQTVCYTREMTKGTYYIRMKLNGVWLDNSHYCNNAYTSWSCRFHVNSGRTPLVESLNATTLEPESLIKVRGRLFTNLISSAVATATNGQTSNIARIWLTSGQCDHLKDTDVPYGISLEGAEGESNWGSLTCKIRSKYVGNQNFSFIVNEGFGRSRPYSSTKHLSADNRIYMLQTYAVVTDVSPKEGSTVGGTMLTISGRNFDDQSGIRARVMVGGVACTVTSVTDNQIICKTATEPATSKSVYAGGRGLNIEVFPGITDKDATLDTSVSGYLTFHTDKSESGTISGENFVSRSRGFYYPAVTGGHIFNLAADDNADLYINSNGEDEAGKTKIITSGGNSASVTLQARTPHYFEIRHLQGTGGANFKLNVKVDTTNYIPENTALAVSEVQTVAISSTLNHEHQSISLEDWVEQTPVSSQWTIETTCSISSCSGHSFTITVFKTSTDPILFGATEFEVKSAITALIPTNSEVETVTYVNDTYDITFKTNRGKIELSATSNSGDLSVTTTEVQVGVPKLDTFTLTVDGYISTPIAFDAPTSHVVNAINSLFGPRCPHQLGTTLAGNYFKHFDFETNTGVYSGAISSENSFCGTRSLKNPSYLFNEWDNSYFTAVYSKVCFAYIGDINSHLWISYFFEDVDNNNAIVEYYLVAFNGLGLEDSTTWKHVCVDVEKLLKEKHANGNNFKVRQLYIAAGNDPDTDHYVDNFFIASSVSLSDDQIQEMQRRIQPSAVPSIKLESLTVTKTNNIYNVTFYPIDCGSSFPLLGVAFTSQTTISSDEAVYGIDWNSTSRVRVTRLMAASPAVTGTFDISFADPTFGSLSALPTNISADDLTLQLQSLAGVNSVNVVKSGTCYGYSWQTTFVSPGGKYPAMTTDGTNMVGKSPVVTPTVVTEGGINMNPIYGDFFSTGHSQPQVQVYINNVPSKCDGDYDSDAATSCGFQWSSAATPTLTNVTPTSGVTGDSISLTGSGFGTTASDVTVTIGGMACTVSTVTDTSVSCTLGESPGGTQTIAVKVAGKGSAASTAGTFTVTSAVTSITPTSGSTNGCTTVTIAGSAFDTLSSTVAIGGYDCVVSMVTYSTIVCTTSAATSAGSVSVVVTTSSVAATSSVTYEYTDTGAASISAISSTTYTSNGGTRVTITGTNFGTTQGVVTFGTNSVTVASWSDTSIEIDTPALAPAIYDLHVIIQPNGCALNSVAASVTYGFSVSSISETTGSHMGGTTITIAGEGFTTDTSVTFGDITCDATVTSSTEMTCVTSSSGVVHNVTNDGAHA